MVESNGYNDRTWLLQGYPHTEALRMTERLRRTDFGHLEIAVTFDDPKAYNKAWTLPVSARLAPDTELMEAVCNERPDNGQQHWVGRVSDAQKTAVKVAPEILAKYVGVYKGIYIRNPVRSSSLCPMVRCPSPLTEGRNRLSFRSRRPNFPVPD